VMRPFCILALLLCAPLTWGAPAATTPNAPLLTATVNNADVVLTWTAPTANTNGSAVASTAYTFKSYFIYRSACPIPPQLGTPYAGQTPAPAITGLTYTDTGAAALGDCYGATAWYCDATGCSQSALSNVVQAVALLPVPVVTGTVTLSWTNPTQNADGSALTDLA
jgi:hypothetical protein